MIAYRSIRDPQYEDELYESSFEACISSGPSVTAGIQFIEDLLGLLGNARIDLFSAGAIERKVLKESANARISMSKTIYVHIECCTHSILIKGGSIFLLSLKGLHELSSRRP